MTMAWLMTVQEAGTLSQALINWPPEVEFDQVEIDLAVEFDLAPRWISLNPGVGNEPPPNPNCFSTLRRWPGSVEIRRPDGTRVSAELYPGWVHLNFAYKFRAEHDPAGRIRNPWRQLVVLKGVSVEEVPLGSEIWGEITDEDFQTSKDLRTAQSNQ